MIVTQGWMVECTYVTGAKQFFPCHTQAQALTIAANMMDLRTPFEVRIVPTTLEREASK